MLLTRNPLQSPCRDAMVKLAGFQASWYVYSASRYGSFPFPRTGPWCGESFSITTTPFCCYQLTALGGDHDSVASHERGWPWRFEQPGRLSTELPGEEAFTGFGGIEALLVGDLGTDIDDMRDEYSYQTASREIRNACHSQVSIDPAPGAEVVVLSESGASLTGIPPEAVSITNTGTGDQGSRGSSSIRWSEREHKELAHYLTGTTLFRGCQPLGCCYGGHQFGHWVGQLGDGRVATLGEIKAVCNRDNVTGVASTWCGNLIEVQLKGIGKTPFSRGGHGKAVLNSCLSEYLFSQAFIGLGLETVVTVSVCSTGERTVTRGSNGTLKPVSGAVLCRTAPSFLRFGSFELPARRSELNVVRTLADFCLRHLGPYLKRGKYCPWSSHAEDLSPMPREDEVNTKGPFCSFSAGQEGERLLPSYLPKSNKGRAEESPGYNVGEVWTRNAYLELLVDVIQATARMVASWQAFGFCHGVLNTDNFSLLGIAIDFGSCGFMEHYDPAWCPNESDSGLRYTFQKQPDVSAWNCDRLADSFSSLVGVSGVAEAKKVFSPTFDAAYTEHLQRKLGLKNMKLVGGRGWVDILKNQDTDGRSHETVGDVSSDTRFVLELFWLMACTGTDFTKTWQSFINVPSLSEARRGRAECYEGDEEVLRPIADVLRASRVPREHRREWACWIREYMARIDSQGIGRSDHRGPEYGRRKRLDIMKKSNPMFVLRGSELKQALRAVDSKDMKLVRQLDTKLSRPYASESLE